MHNTVLMCAHVTTDPHCIAIIVQLICPSSWGMASQNTHPSILPTALTRGESWTFNSFGETAKPMKTVRYDSVEECIVLNL